MSIRNAPRGGAVTEAIVGAMTDISLQETAKKQPADCLDRSVKLPNSHRLTSLNWPTANCGHSAYCGPATAILFKEEISC
jgi:hypothetical protein